MQPPRGKRPQPQVLPFFKDFVERLGLGACLRQSADTDPVRMFFPEACSGLNWMPSTERFKQTLDSLVKAKGDDAKAWVDKLLPIALVSAPSKDFTTFAFAMASTDTSQTAISLIHAMTALQVHTAKMMTAWLAEEMQSCPIGTDDWAKGMETSMGALEKCKDLLQMLPPVKQHFTEAKDKDEQLW